MPQAEIKTQLTLYIKCELYVCVCIYIYIYIYIYILIHRQTVSFYHNYSVWLDMQDASSLDRNPPNFMLDLVSYHLAISATYIYKYLFF